MLGCWPHGWHPNCPVLGVRERKRVENAIIAPVSTSQVRDVIADEWIYRPGQETRWRSLSSLRSMSALKLEWSVIFGDLVYAQTDHPAGLGQEYWLCCI